MTATVMGEERGEGREDLVKRGQHCRCTKQCRKCTRHCKQHVLQVKLRKHSGNAQTSATEISRRQLAKCHYCILHKRPACALDSFIHSFIICVKSKPQLKQHTHTHTHRCTANPNHSSHAILCSPMQANLPR